MSRNPLELPLPVVVDNLLPLLSNRDLFALRSVSKQAKALVEDEVLWKRKVLADFTFPAHASARMGGWFNLYSGLSNPHVYVWGQSDNGRLGIGPVPNRMRQDYMQLDGGIPYPIKLDAIESPQQRNSQGRRLGTAQEEEQALGAVVEIVAGGWSFHARTSTGRVWAWGTMDGEAFDRAPSMRDPATVISTPQLVHDLPPIQSLSGGRCHAVALTQDNRILEWRAWGSIYEHEGFPAGVTAAASSAAAGSSGDSASPSTNIKQLEAGWSFTAILTHTGQVWLWYSDWSADAFTRAYYRGHEREAMMLSEPPGYGHLKRFPISVTPVQLPSIAPDHHHRQQHGQEQQDDANKIVQIGAGEDFIIALTQAGTLHRIDLHLRKPRGEDHLVIRQLQANMSQGDPRDIEARIHQALMTRFVETRAQWERLSAFEDPQSLSGFDAAWLENKQGGKGAVGKLSHISAHFRQFVTFHAVVPAEDGSREDYEGGDAQTLVLLGSSTSAEPQLIPELQARGVIKVTMGDYHYGALTQKGEILTWGSFSKGALGNWQVPWLREAAAAAAPADDGRIIDDSEVGEQGEGDEGDRGWFSNLVPLPRMFRGPPPRGGVFQPRIGFAGRGRVGHVAAPPVGARQTHQQSQDSVERPTLIHIHPQPGTERDATPFAFDLAFAGWHSSALVMDAPAPTAAVE